MLKIEINDKQIRSFKKIASVVNDIIPNLAIYYPKPEERADLIDAYLEFNNFICHIDNILQERKKI